MEWPDNQSERQKYSTIPSSLRAPITVSDALIELDIEVLCGGYDNGSMMITDPKALLESIVFGTHSRHTLEQFES